MDISKDSAKKHFVGLVGSGALEAEEVSGQVLILRLNRKALALPGFFALIGALSILWYFGALGGIFSGVQKGVAIPIIGALLIIIALVAVIRLQVRLVFDKSAGVFGAKAALPFGAGRKIVELPLGKIVAVQILYATPGAACACGGTSGVYEINLVCKRADGERIGLAVVRRRDEAEKLARRIAGFVNVQIIDHSGQSCGA